jgi:DNA polymerase
MEERAARDGSTYMKEVFSYMGKSQITLKWQRIKSHGGRTTEQATQATARDVLAVGMRRAAKAGFPLIGSVHDELIGLTRKGDNRFNSQTLREFMVEPIDWAPGLPLNGSASDFAFYRK